MNMKIKQFEDRGLSHYSYALLSENEVALIDPGRNPAPYYEFARQHQARITAVLETHSHDDFVSSQLDIAGTTGARNHVSETVQAGFPHQGPRDGNQNKLGLVPLLEHDPPGPSLYR